MCSTQDENRHQQSDVQYGGRPGWPHHSIGVPGPAGGAYRPTPAYTGNNRHAAGLVHDENHHQRQSDVKYYERHSMVCRIASYGLGMDSTVP
jgi:hypothetical protein